MPLRKISTTMISIILLNNITILCVGRVMLCGLATLACRLQKRAELVLNTDYGTFSPIIVAKR